MSSQIIEIVHFYQTLKIGVFTKYVLTLEAILNLHFPTSTGVVYMLPCLGAHANVANLC